MSPAHKAPEDLVPHPRFGKAYSPDTSVPADVSKQHPSAGPYCRYVDRLLWCHNCMRPFVFYALEQKHWYETLGFYQGAACERCPECRKARRRLHRRFQRYSLMAWKEDLSDCDLVTLADDAVFLYRSGLLEDEQKLRRAKNLAVARIPEAPAARALLSALSEILDIDGQRLGYAEGLMIRGIIRLLDTGADVVTEKQARALVIPPDQLDMGSIPSYDKAFERLRHRGLLTWKQDRSGIWGVRPTAAAVAATRTDLRNA